MGDKVVPRIVPCAVVCLEQAVKLREIRNDCAEHMTRYTEQITEAEQGFWWAKFGRFVHCFIYINEAEQPVGFGVIRREVLDDDYPHWSRPTVTGGVVTSMRGQGYGEAIFKHLVVAAGLPCFLEVREANTTAVALYRKLGFQVAGNVKGALRMQLSVADAKEKGLV